MEYSNPVMNPNHTSQRPFWKTLQSNFGFLVIGLMCIGVAMGYFQTIDSDDPIALGDLVVEQTTKPSLSNFFNERPIEDREYVLVVEDVETGRLSRVAVTYDYLMWYPPGAYYYGEEGVLADEFGQTETGL